ncbi:unnamed protein product, partial [Symbiodinium necroappetens]
ASGLRHRGPSQGRPRDPHLPVPCRFGPDGRGSGPCPCNISAAFRSLCAGDQQLQRRTS